MCKQCKIKPVYEFTNKRKVCANCFIRYFQKKFLYTIRRFNMIKKDDVVYLKCSKNFKEVVLNDLFDIFSSRLRIKVIGKKSRQVSKIVDSSTIDSESNEILQDLLKRDFDNLKIAPVEKNRIKPLYLFLDNEILLYAKLKKFKFEIKIKKDKISRFINDLEKKHPEVKRAVVNSCLELF